MIEVEVRGRLGQFIKAVLKNVIDSDGVVSYPTSNLEERIPLSKLRFPPNSSKDVQAGQDAEVLFGVAAEQFSDVTGSIGGSCTDDGSTNSVAQSHLDDQLSLPAWWPCRVHKVRDEVAVVKLQVTAPSNSSPDEVARCTQLSNVTDIVNRNTLRHPCSLSSVITPSMIHRHSIAIPKELADFASDLSVHTEFLKHCGEPTSSYFDSESSSLTVLSTDENTIRNVGLLEDTHLKMLRQKWAITRSLRQTMRSLEVNRGHDGHANMTNSRSSGDWDVDPNMFVERFYVPQQLMGLAIGAQGSNIRSARNIPDVVSVRLREAGDRSRRNGDHIVDNLGDCGDSSLFIVEARTAEAASLARAKLEFTALYLGVPRRYVGRLIGRRTNNIHSIIEKSGVVQIKFNDHIKGPSDEETLVNMESLNLNHSGGVASPPNIRRIFLRTGGIPASSQPHADEEYGGFILSGTRDAVERARLLISFQLDYIFDLEKMEAEKVALMRNLSYSGPEVDNGFPSRGYGEGPRGRGTRGIRRSQRSPQFPPERNVPNYGQYPDDNCAPYGTARRPPRDSRSVRGYNGDLRPRRPGVRGGGGMRRGSGVPHDYNDRNDRAGSNGDVVDRRRGSQDSDTLDSNLGPDADSGGLTRGKGDAGTKSSANQGDDTQTSGIDERERHSSVTPRARAPPPRGLNRPDENDGQSRSGQSRSRPFNGESRSMGSGPSQSRNIGIPTKQPGNAST